VLATVLLLAALVLETREHVHAGPSPHWLAFVEIAVVLGYGPLAVLVVSRQPRNPVPWFLLYFATTAGLQIVLAYVAQRMLAEGVDDARWLAWVTDWMVSPAFATLYVLLLQLFPDGKPASPRFRPLVPATVAIIALAAVEQPLTEGKLQSYEIANPAGILPDWVQIPTFLAFVVVSALSLLSLVVRFRASSGRERLQLQLWLFASAVFYVTAALHLQEPWNTLFWLNPVAVAVEGWRWALLGGPHMTYWQVALGTLSGLVILAAGVIYFRRKEREFADIV